MSDTVVEKLTGSIDCKQGAVRAVRFNVDGNYILTCGSDKTLKLWNPYKETLLKSYSGHGYEVLDARGSCDNGQLCSCGMDKSVIYWDVATGKMLRKYRGHAGCVNCVQFNEESSVILSGSIDGSVRIWDCKSKRHDPIQVMDEAKDSVTSIQVSDHEILTGSADGRIRRYDLRMGQMFVNFIGKPVTSVNFTRDSQCCLSSTLDHTVRLLDKDTGELLNEYTGHKNSDYRMDSVLNAKDTHILSGSEDGFIYIWELVDAKITNKLKIPDGRVVHSLSHHHEDACLVAAAGNKVHVWKSKYGQANG